MSARTITSISTVHTVVESPLGPLTLVADDGRLAALYMTAQRHLPPDARLGEPVPDDDPVFADAVRELREYFAGERTTFDLPLREHGTPFEQAVWARLRAIPYGETTTYGEIARELNSSPRAVGRANGRNQISIVVPCHRVVGANGSLTGYAGGIPTKQRLLDHERGQVLLAGRPSRPPGVAS